MTTIKEICDYLHNYFEHKRIHGTFTIENGTLDVSEVPIIEGQYFKIEGSILNDGIYKHPASDLRDESFEGAILLQRIPPDIEAIAGEIDEWKAENAKALTSPYQSESFGGYSYSKASGGAASGGGATFTWKDAFGHRLDAYRKLP